MTFRVAGALAFAGLGFMLRGGVWKRWVRRGSVRGLALEDGDAWGGTLMKAGLVLLGAAVVAAVVAAV